MGGRLDPRVAAVRSAVRTDLRALIAELDDGPTGPTGSTVLAACSGGADSTALAAALAFEAPRLGLRPGAITVDHGLQAGSRDRADRLVARLRGMGLEPCTVATVEVPPGTAGPEAAARTARYAALNAAADAVGACAVLLGHTADDQAETVLLGLARGSGIRSLAGMRGVNGRYRRPLLGLARSVTAGACTAQDLPVWTDPHNSDPRFARVRVRNTVLPVLERELGPGVAAALARTAEQARVDADALDELAAVEFARLGGPTGELAGELAVAALAALPPAIGTRVLRSWLLAAGAPATDLGYRHVLAVLELVSSWHGQRWVEVPGGLRVTRHDGRLRVVATAPAVGS
jgi:tRNA(Ile)-lysidine synthase